MKNNLIILLTSFLIGTAPVRQDTLSVTSNHRKVVEADWTCIELYVSGSSEDDSRTAIKHYNEHLEVIKKIVKEDTAVVSSTSRLENGTFKIEFRVGYTVMSSNVKIYIKNNFEILSTVLDHLLQTNITQNDILSIEYGINNPENLILECQRQATLSAEKTAETIATAAGRKLGKIENIYIICNRGFEVTHESSRIVLDSEIKITYSLD